MERNITMQEIAPYLKDGARGTTRRNWGAADGESTRLAVRVVNEGDTIHCVLEGTDIGYDYPIGDFLMNDVKTDCMGNFKDEDGGTWIISDYPTARQLLRKVVAASMVLSDPELMFTSNAVDIYVIRHCKEGQTSYVKVSPEQWERLKELKEPKPYSRTFRQFVHDPWLTLKTNEAIEWQILDHRCVFHPKDMERELDYPMDYWD